MKVPADILVKIAANLNSKYKSLASQPLSEIVKTNLSPLILYVVNCFRFKKVEIKANRWKKSKLSIVEISPQNKLLGIIFSPRHVLNYGV